MTAVGFARVPSMAALLVIAGCAGQGSGPGQGKRDAGPDGAARDGQASSGPDASGDGGGEGGTTAGHSGLRVALQSDDVELCPGQCATLTAVVEQARGEVTLTWGQGLEGEGPHEVCPEETTRYEVEATDDVRAGEFADEGRASDQRTISVVECDPDSPVLCEARYRHAFPADGNVLRTDVAWVSAFTADSALARGPDGSMYLMGAYGTRLDLGADTLDAPSGMHGFVHKIGASCEPLWTRRLDPSVVGDVLLPGAVTSGPDGNVYAVSTAGPLLDLDPLAPYPFRFATEIVIDAFTGDGERIYRKTLPISLGGAVHDVVVDDGGRLYITGFANSLTDFGGGPLGLSPTTLVSFLLSVDAQGRHRITEAEARAYRIDRAGDSLVFVGNALDRIDLLASLLGLGLFTTQPVEPTIEARTLPGLGLKWERALDQTALWPGHLAGHADGTSTALAEDSQSEEHDDGSYTQTFGYHLLRNDGTGQAAPSVQVLEMSSTVPADEQDVWYGSYVRELVAAPTGSSVAFIGQYSGDVTLEDGRVLPGRGGNNPDSPFGDEDVFVAKVAGDDTLAWVRRLRTGSAAVALGVALDGDGHVWAATQSRVDEAGPTEGASYEQDLVVTKLRATP